MTRLNLSFLLVLAVVVVAAGVGCAPSKAGDGCDAANDNCPDGLVCQKDGDNAVCHVIVGAACDADADDAFCADGSACSQGTCGGRGGACAKDEQCADDTCADVGGGNKACEPPVQAAGQVIDLLSGDPIEGAHVIALDVDGAAVSRVAITDADGKFVLDLFVPRDDDGSPVAGAAVTLRADAADYETFPNGIRQALPVDLDEAAEKDDDDGDRFVVENAATTIALLQLPDAEQGRPTVSGSVAVGGGGVLIVATGGADVTSAITDSDGAFTLFNVAAGDITVSGYAQGVQLEPEAVTVADADVKDVVLAAASGGTGAVSGSVQIVNGNGNGTTSVVLVVADTFDDTIARGETPRGLRADDVTGAFSIDGVPDGEYVVLAAFDNDGLTRDPDTNIGGTELVHVVVAGGADVEAPESFKVTGALDVFSPGADGLDVVTSAPDFVFADDSSEERYDVVLFDALGNLTFQTSIDGVSGGDNVTVPYTGPALEDGMIYQYRATSVKTQGGGGESAIAATEDLKGTFLFSP